MSFAKQRREFLKLDDKAFCICRPIPVFWPEWNVTTMLYPDMEPLHQSCFAVHNGILCFHIHGWTYVIPSSDQNVEALVACSFVQKDMHVPFSNGEYPCDPEMKASWDKLLTEA